MRPPKPMANAEVRASSETKRRPQSPDRAQRVDCAVVIVTYNSARDVTGLLDSLAGAAAGLSLRTVVVDNGSTDATIDLVRSRADVSCVETGANLGFAGGINVGRKHAGEYSALLVVNPDVILAAGALREMLSALSDPSTGIVAPMLLNPDGSRYPSLKRQPTLARAIGDAMLGSRVKRRPGWLSEIVWDEASYSYRHAVDWAGGAALLISAACDDAVGCWDERYFLYCEETDYATRARAAGFRTEYVPTARALHRGGGSGKSGALVALLAISRLRYAEKHGRRLWPYRVVLIIAALLRSGDPAHRCSLRAILRRSQWPVLTASLQHPAAATDHRAT
jgi:GT2 family glycosyltransferase